MRIGEVCYEMLVLFYLFLPIRLMYVGMYRPGGLGGYDTIDHGWVLFCHVDAGGGVDYLLITYIIAAFCNSGYSYRLICFL